MSSDASGQDVSQRIRNAIKSKLIDIGCYVDDELPDYVMVMIANKRSKEQMKTDLELFLGEHCGSFCDWLHEVLSHLHRFAREGKHKIELFDDKVVKPPKPKERAKEKERDKHGGSGDEVSLHLDLDEKKEFDEIAVKDCTTSKKKSSRRSRSRSPLKRIEERTKKRLRERVDEVAKEVKKKDACKVSESSIKGEYSNGANASGKPARKRIEIADARVADSSTASRASSTKQISRSAHVTSPRAVRKRSSSLSGKVARRKSVSPSSASEGAAGKSGVPSDLRGRGSSREQRRRSREDRCRNRDNLRKEVPEEVGSVTKLVSTTSYEREAVTAVHEKSRFSGVCEDTRVKYGPRRPIISTCDRSAVSRSPERVINKDDDLGFKRRAVPKDRLASTVEKVVNKDGNLISAVESDVEYDPSCPQLRSVATVAPRRRLVVDRDHLEKNKILAKAVSDAARSTTETISITRRADGTLKRSIQDRLGAYVTETIANRVAEIARQSGIPPSLGDDDDDEEDNEGNAGENDTLNSASAPRIIVTMKKIPGDIDTQALDADQEVELEDLRLCLLRGNALKSNAVSSREVSSTVSGTNEILANKRKQADCESLPARKKMVVTNKKGQTVTTVVQPEANDEVTVSDPPYLDGKLKSSDGVALSRLHLHQALQQRH